MKDENGEVIDETLIPNAFNKYFVELGGKLANKIPRSSILPDSFLSDVHHPVSGLPSFQEISENDVLKLLHGLGPNKASGIDGITKVTELWNRIKNSYIDHSRKRLRPRLHIFACLQF